MLNIKEYEQSEMILYTMDELVPEDSLFRKIDACIDFTFIYDEVKDLYCCTSGRSSIDPVFLFKLVFIEALVRRYAGTEVFENIIVKEVKKRREWLEKEINEERVKHSRLLYNQRKRA